MGHSVQKLGVVLAQGVHALPADLDHGDSTTVKPDGHHNEAGEGRQAPGGDLEDFVGLLVDHLAVGEATLAQGLARGWQDADALGHSRARGKGLQATAVLHEARGSGGVHALGGAAEVEPAHVGDVGQDAVSLHGLADLLQRTAKEAAHVLVVQRVQHNVHGASQALVGAPELRHGPLGLMLGCLGVTGKPRHQKVGLARGMDGVAADAHGREMPPDGAAEHQGPGAVHGKRQVLGAERHVGNACLKLEEPADVRAHKALRSREEQGCRLVVCQKHPAGAVERHDGVPGELQQAREGSREAPLADALHVTLSQSLRHVSPRRGRRGRRPSAAPGRSRAV